ncbi:MAG: methyltransferase domain-containing protein, partial [Actinobacteria bacterium]
MRSTPPRPGRPSAPPEADIRAMFDSVARRYDVVNALLSFGLDRRWRRAVARSLAVRPGDIVLDLGCGTGGLGRLLAGRCEVVGLDLSVEMLKVARRRGPAGAFVQA